MANTPQQPNVHYTTGADTSNDHATTERFPVGSSTNTEEATALMIRDHNSAAPSTIEEKEATVTSTMPVDNSAVRQHRQSRKFLSAEEIVRICTVVLGILWLAPAGYIIYLNISQKILGVVLACQDCRASLYPSLAVSVSRYDTQNKNVMSGLQIAAKILEVWFVFMITSMVYNITALLATKQGLPISLHTAYMEYGFLYYPFRFETWSWRRHSRKHAGASSRRASKLYVLIAFITLMTLLVNVIGPAMAVLVIPSLQWRDINFTTNGTFGAFNANSPPSRIVGTNCTSSELSKGLFNCTASMWADTLDALTVAHLDDSSLASLNPKLQFGSIELALRNIGSWSPSYQIALELSSIVEPLQELYFSSTDGSGVDVNYAQTTYHQSGPSLAIGDNEIGILGPMTSVELGQDKNVVCVSNSDYAVLGENATYPIACFGTGSAWSNPTNMSTFHLQGLATADSDEEGSESSNSSDVAMQVYGIGRMIVIPYTQFPCSSLVDQGCDWDNIFSNSSYSEFFLDNVLVYTVSLYNGTEHTLLLGGQTFSGFTDYTLGFDAQNNLISWDTPTQLSNNPVIIHPDWVLAALSVESNGTIPASRPVASYFTALISSFQPDSPGGPDPAEIASLVTGGITGLTEFAFSLIDFSVIPAPLSIILNQTEHPALEYYQRIQVWSYSRESKSAKLSIFVVVLGCLMVLASTLLSIVAYTVKFSLNELIIMALQSSPSGESGVELDKERYTMKKLENGSTRLVPDSYDQYVE
jgi:hypothetical protein